jgi:MOSC domain-containing protein YiiM
MHPITLVSVNTGVLERLTPASKSRTGIRKMPVGGAVLCDTLGIVGDAIGNHKHHGGPDQAVYLYSAEDYAWWSDTIGQPCAPGLFGENLTISRWWETPRAGDRVQFGEVLLELTAPRIPCSTLAAHMGNPRFVDRFTRAARPGAYARVLHTGALAAGLTGHVSPGDASWPAIVELFDMWIDATYDRARLIHALRAPVGIRLRERFLQRSAPR